MNESFSNLVQVLGGGIHWSLPAEQSARLLGPEGLKLDEWLRTGQARIVKQGQHRIVYRVELPGLIFYLKHNKLPDARSWVRQLVRPSKARMEFNRALAVARRGLPTISPLALGEKQAFLGVGESYLITESIENSQSLYAFILSLQKLPARQLTSIRQHLARELGSLMGRIHQAGIAHDDLHCGNILVRDQGKDGFALFLIDLNGVRIGTPLTWKSSLENLAILNRWFLFRSTRTDRLRFWRAYQASRQTEGPSQAQGDDESLIQQVETHTLTSIQLLCAHFERRCLKSNRHFHEIHGSETSGHVVSDLDRADWESLQADPDEPFRRPGATLIKDSPSSTITEFDVRVGGQVRRVIYKRFRVTRWTDPFTALVRSSPARRSWIAGQALIHRSLPTPRPLLLVHRRRFGLQWEGYLMTEKINNAQNLHEFLASVGEQKPSEGRKTLRRRIEQVALVMREMHRLQVSNRDCKATNWLIGSPQESTDFQRDFGGLWIIDLVGVKLKKKLDDEQRIKNLARLNASFLSSPALTRTDRLRFLRVYLHWNLSGKESWKKWWHSIDRATQAKAARNFLSGRVLT